MKDLKAKVTISRVSSNHGEDYVSIRVEDEDAGIEFLDLSLSIESFGAALLGMAYQKGTMEVRSLEHVGKVIERDVLSFPLPIEAAFRDKEAARKTAKEVCPDGWIHEDYFSSKDSFFIKDGRVHARCRIRRWVDKAIEGEKDD